MNRKPMAILKAKYMKKYILFFFIYILFPSYKIKTEKLFLHSTFKNFRYPTMNKDRNFTP